MEDEEVKLNDQSGSERVRLESAVGNETETPSRPNRTRLLEPGKPRTGMGKLMRVPSVALTETSPSKSIREQPAPDLAALSFGEYAPVEWVIKLKMATKSFAYAWIINAKKAMDVIDKHGRGESTGYQTLKLGIDVVFSKLAEFLDAKVIDGTALVRSPLFHDFASEVVTFRKPKKMGDSGTSEEFKSLRTRAAEISREFMNLREIVVEALAAVMETETTDVEKPDEKLYEAFGELPAVETPELVDKVQTELEERRQARIRSAPSDFLEFSGMKSHFAESENPLRADDTFGGQSIEASKVQSSVSESAVPDTQSTFATVPGSHTGRTMSYTFSIETVFAVCEEATEYREIIVQKVLQSLQEEDEKQHFVFFAAFLCESIGDVMSLRTPIIFLGLGGTPSGVGIRKLAGLLADEGWGLYVFRQRRRLESAGPYPASLPAEKELIFRKGRRTVKEEHLYHDAVHLGSSIGIFPPLVAGQEKYHAKSHGVTTKIRGTDNHFGISCAHGWRDAGFVDHASLVGSAVQSPAYVDAKNSYDLVGDVYGVSGFQLQSFKKEFEEKPSKRTKERFERERARNGKLKDCNDKLHQLVEDTQAGSLSRIGKITINKVEYHETPNASIYKRLDYCLYALDGERLGVNGTIEGNGTVATWAAGELKFDDDVVLYGRTISGLRGKVCGVLAYSRAGSEYTIEDYCILATESSPAPANAAGNSGAVWISVSNEETVGLHTSHCDVQVGDDDMLNFSTPASRTEQINYIQSKCDGGRVFQVFPCFQTSEYGEKTPFIIRAGMATSFKDILEDAKKEGYDLVHIDEDD